MESRLFLHDNDATGVLVKREYPLIEIVWLDGQKIVWNPLNNPSDEDVLQWLRLKMPYTSYEGEEWGVIPAVNPFALTLEYYVNRGGRPPVYKKADQRSDKVHNLPTSYSLNLAGAAVEVDSHQAPAWTFLLLDDSSILEHLSKYFVEPEKTFFLVQEQSTSVILGEGKLLERMSEEMNEEHKLLSLADLKQIREILR